MKIFLTFFIITFSVFFNNNVWGQNVSITIDDVPNVRNFQKENYQSTLLKRLDSLQIPITIFINEGQLYKTDSVSKNIALLESWIERRYINAGNHTYGHLRYSDTEFDLFKNDIEKGEKISLELSNKHGKAYRYFRLPYNDLGKDSIQHHLLEEYLNSKEYLLTPFTIESIDWMFNYVYEYYINQNDLLKAEEIGENYVLKTIEFFDYFDSLTTKLYGRRINHIYLCHDNKLNADFLPLLIGQLKLKNYSFIDLETAMQDSVYAQTDNYFKKWGISWIYRWMRTQEERLFYMTNEPNMDEIELLYNQLQTK